MPDSPASTRRLGRRALVAGISGRGAARADPRRRSSTTTISGLPRRGSSRRRLNSASGAPISSRRSAAGVGRARRTPFVRAGDSPRRTSAPSNSGIGFPGRWTSGGGSGAETEAARAQLLASEWGRRAVVDNAGQPGRKRVLQPADARPRARYFERTLVSRQESLRLTQVRESGGVTSLIDVRQAEQLVYGGIGRHHIARAGDRAAGKLHQHARRG